MTAVVLSSTRHTTFGTRQGHCSKLSSRLAAAGGDALGGVLDIFTLQSFMLPGSREKRWRSISVVNCERVSFVCVPFSLGQGILFRLVASMRISMCLSLVTDAGSYTVVRLV